MSASQHLLHVGPVQRCINTTTNLLLKVDCMGADEMALDVSQHLLHVGPVQRCINTTTNLLFKFKKNIQIALHILGGGLSTTPYYLFTELSLFKTGPPYDYV
jgi:hypothetical protein